MYRWAHTLEVAVPLGAAVGMIVWGTSRLLGRRGDGHRSELGLGPCLAGGVLGGVTHPLLDASMHRDVTPFMPFVAGNPLPVEAVAEEVRRLARVGQTNGDAMETAGRRIRCIGCGGLVPRMEGPTHRYAESSPGCWHLYGQVLSREYSDRAFGALHRLTVDSYAVQHPGRPSPQTIQSVCVHLMSLCLVVERGLAIAYATRIMAAATRTKARFSWLTPPASLGAVTVADVAEAATPLRHEETVRAWADAAWSAWAEHHATVRRWLPA